MNRANIIKINHSFLAKAIIVFVIGLCLNFCANDSPVAEKDYSSKIVGHWQGTVGNLKETMTINGDSTFSCQLHTMGFIANTLSERVRGKIHGTWKITGAIMTLRITGEKNERTLNRKTSSTIVLFREDKLELKSDNGEISHFRRVLTL